MGRPHWINVTCKCDTLVMDGGVWKRKKGTMLMSRNTSPAKIHPAGSRELLEPEKEGSKQGTVGPIKAAGTRLRQSKNQRKKQSKFPYNFALLLRSELDSSGGSAKLPELRCL